LIQNADLLAFFEEEYRREYGTRRDIRPGDRLYDDLKVESLFVTEVLVALEEDHDLRLIHDPRVWKVKTVGEMLELVGVLHAEQHPAAAVGSAA
jgi:acyl carrier protein